MLVLGGARSGKSRHALSLVENSGLAPVMIATARADDAEMAARIERHRQQRGPHWRTVEEPLDLAGALAKWRSPDRAVVVDCLTLFLSNQMATGADIVGATTALTSELARPAGLVILVSNEIGFGLVPMNSLGRAFRDEQGLLNQAIARVCNRVTLVVAGLPLELKPEAIPKWR